MGKGEKDGGCPRRAAGPWSGLRPCQEARWCMVSVCEHIPAQESMFTDSYLRVVDGWCLGIGLDLGLLSSLMSSQPLMSFSDVLW